MSCRVCNGVEAVTDACMHMHLVAMEDDRARMARLSVKENRAALTQQVQEKRQEQAVNQAKTNKEKAEFVSTSMCMWRTMTCREGFMCMWYVECHVC